MRQVSCLAKSALKKREGRRREDSVMNETDEDYLYTIALSWSNLSWEEAKELEPLLIERMRDNLPHQTIIVKQVMIN